jgi:hypothetical protein
MIGARFNGPVDLINYHAQNLSINRGAWKSMENEWDRQLDPNKTNIAGNPGVAGAVTDVVITINPSDFPAGSKRPSRFNVSYTYGGITPPSSPKIILNP